MQFTKLVSSLLTTQKRLELSTFAVTGRRSNQLSHWAILQFFKILIYLENYIQLKPTSSSIYLSLLWLCPRPISNSQLHVLPHFHLCPIYLVVFKGVYFTKNGISHLEGGFTLRCLQRLSLPDLATRPWLWQANRSTSGPSIPVLSY